MGIQGRLPACIPLSLTISDAEEEKEGAGVAPKEILQRPSSLLPHPLPEVMPSDRWSELPGDPEKKKKKKAIFLHIIHCKNQLGHFTLPFLLFSFHLHQSKPTSHPLFHKSTTVHSPSPFSLHRPLLFLMIILTRFLLHKNVNIQAIPSDVISPSCTLQGWLGPWLPIMLRLP